MRTAMIHTKYFPPASSSRGRPHDQLFCQSGWPDGPFMYIGYTVKDGEGTHPLCSSTATEQRWS